MPNGLGEVHAGGPEAHEAGLPFEGAKASPPLSRYSAETRVAMRTRPTPTPKDQARIAYAHRPRVKTEIPGPKARHATRQASLPAKATVPAPAPSTAALARDTPSIGISSIAILDADPNSIPKYGKVELQVVLQDVEALSEKYYEPDPTHGGVNLSATFTPVSGGPQQHVNGFYDGT
ncbi:MAG: hypothetical protein L6Q38_13205, partial [Nitrospira sp.]|nr:hypothetical protein [Nitrospira sp.]